MPSVKKEISLLPNDENNNTLIARILKWLTTVGRIVIIFTELIVISAFLSRFWLDRKNSDLSEVIRQQTAILASTQDFETDYRSLQERLKYISSFYQSEPKYVDNLNSLIQSLPDGIYFQSLNLSSDPKTSQVLAQVELYSYQEDPIVNFITNLKLNPDISSVNVQKIEKKTKDSKYYLSLSLIFPKK
ncbi:MAG: PilN domain-containing protein [Candidatus Shapirobacteria bacterium]|jgi:Tfp pilus assembly protein PilN